MWSIGWPANASMTVSLVRGSGLAVRTTRAPLARAVAAAAALAGWSSAITSTSVSGAAGTTVGSRALSGITTAGVSPGAVDSVRAQAAADAPTVTMVEVPSRATSARSTLVAGLTVAGVGRAVATGDEAVREGAGEAVTVTGASSSGTPSVTAVLAARPRFAGSPSPTSTTAGDRAYSARLVASANSAAVLPASTVVSATGTVVCGRAEATVGDGDGLGAGGLGAPMPLPRVQPAVSRTQTTA